MMNSLAPFSGFLPGIFGWRATKRREQEEEEEEEGEEKEENEYSE